MNPVVTKLVMAGANIVREEEGEKERENSNTNNALHFAALASNTQTIKVLLMKKLQQTELDQKNEKGETPLLIACKIENQKIVRMLVREGANPHISNENGETPMNVSSPLILPILEKGSETVFISIFNVFD